MTDSGDSVRREAYPADAVNGLRDQAVAPINDLTVALDSTAGITLRGNQGGVISLAEITAHIFIFQRGNLAKNG